MPAALITGITGQDGSYLARFLLEKGYEVIGTVQRDYSVGQHDTQRLEGIVDKIKLESADLLDPLSLFRVLQQYRPAEIYNLGAQTDVRVSFDTPFHTTNTIVQGTLTLLDFIKGLHFPTRFFQASSSEMFGNSQDVDGFQRETTPMEPVSPYGCAKLHAHKLVQHYRRSHDLFLSTGISFNHESPQRGINFVTNKVVREAIRIKKGFSSELKLGNLDAARDWGHSKDFVQAMWMMLQHTVPDDFVVATGKSHTVRDLCSYVFSTLGMDYHDFVHIDPKLYRSEELHRLRGDSTKLRTTLGWKPEHTFEGMLDEMISYWSQKINDTRSTLFFLPAISSLPISTSRYTPDAGQMNYSYEILIQPSQPVPLVGLETVITPGKPLLLAQRHPELYAEVCAFWEQESARVSLTRAPDLALALARHDEAQVTRMKKQMRILTPKYRLTNIALEGNRLQLAMDTISYLEVIGINELAARDFTFRDRLLHAGQHDFNDTAAYFANPLAICAVLYGYEKSNEKDSLYIPITKRSDRVMHCPDMYHVFGTLISVEEYSGNLNLAQYLINQLEEKTGLAKDQFGSPQFHAIVRQGVSQIPELICSVPVLANQQQLMEATTEQAPGRYEYNAVSCYTLSQVSDFLSDKDKSLVPSGSAALSLFIDAQKLAA